MREPHVISNSTVSNLKMFIRQSKTKIYPEKLESDIIDRFIEGNLDPPAQEKSILKTIDIKKVLIPPAFLRSEGYGQSLVNKNPIQWAKKYPISVVSIVGKNVYPIVDGVVRFNILKKSGCKKVRVIIEGKVESVSQISTIRGRKILRMNNELSSLEKALGMLIYEYILVKEMGKEAFYGHGGDRAKKRIKKYDFISKQLRVPESTVRTLLNFAKIVGPFGLKGLMKDDIHRNLTIHSINQINASLKKNELPTKIEIAEGLFEVDEYSDEDVTQEISDTVKKAVIDELKHQKGSTGEPRNVANSKISDSRKENGNLRDEADMEDAQGLTIKTEMTKMVAMLNKIIKWDLEGPNVTEQRLKKSDQYLRDLSNLIGILQDKIYDLKFDLSRRKTRRVRMSSLARNKNKGSQ